MANKKKSLCGAAANPGLSHLGWGLRFVDHPATDDFKPGWPFCLEFGPRPARGQGLALISIFCHCAILAHFGYEIRLHKYLVIGASYLLMGLLDFSNVLIKTIREYR